MQHRQPTAVVTEHSDVWQPPGGIVEVHAAIEALATDNEVASWFSSTRQGGLVVTKGAAADGDRESAGAGRVVRVALFTSSDSSRP
ncbi:hypothetical protein GCM10010392_16360 [Streptomyces clavifer]|nr:hypothetical protein GCM10010392_16360 [Streptomyces clavifer]